MGLPDGPELCVECLPYAARLSRLGCRANQDCARRCIDLLESGLPANLHSPIDLERLFTCGGCGEMPASIRQEAQAWTEVIKTQITNRVDRLATYLSREELVPATEPSEKELEYLEAKKEQHRVRVREYRWRVRQRELEAGTGKTLPHERNVIILHKRTNDNNAQTHKRTNATTK